MNEYPNRSQVPTITLEAEPRTDAAATLFGVFEGDERLLHRRGLIDLAEANDFTGKVGQLLIAKDDAGAILSFTGLGHRETANLDAVRTACGAAARHLHVNTVLVELDSFEVNDSSRQTLVEAAAEGALLGAYRFSAYKSDSSQQEPGQVVLSGITANQRENASLKVALEAATFRTDGTYLARDLANRPASDMTAVDFAAIAVEVAQDAGFGAEIWEPQQLRDERLNGLLSVNRGSTASARFVRLTYSGRNGTGADLALVGKGVTFDSGGLSLKPADYMVGMKGDMAGAAAVLAAVATMARLKLPLRVNGYIPLTDNMPGPDALRVGDIITYRNGKTVEVINTDAEGRLILADALCLAVEDKPRAIVDLATLTGACIVALGEHVAGLMASNDRLAEQILAASAAAGEPVWRLPLPPRLRKKLDSPIADIRNIPDGRYGGALAAGLFLQEFVDPEIPWAHLDIAGPADSSEEFGELPKGATGFGVRTLVRLAEDLAVS